MAELDIGRHCQVEHCRQRDFLPFVCNGCSGIFCLEHRSRESHGCSEVNIINERMKTDKHTSYPCSFKDCTEKELVPVICPYCEKNFCLRHRHQSDHECEKLEISKPRMAATQRLGKVVTDSETRETVSKGRKSTKHTETAAKVALMKLKMHADGDKSLPQEFISKANSFFRTISRNQGRSETKHLSDYCFFPAFVDLARKCNTRKQLRYRILEEPSLNPSLVDETERIYFQVFLPKGSKEKSKPMFFCHRWSIGKVIDFAASLASLKNDNNKSTAKKLRLCHITSGEALPLDNILGTWMAKEDCPLYNGGNIILEYLNDEELFLKNVDSYLE